jgi:hypothetical protein
MQCLYLQSIAQKVDETPSTVILLASLADETNTTGALLDFLDNASLQHKEKEYQ